MDSFNIFNNHFRPDFSWQINGIQALVAQRTFSIHSPEFHWKAYPGVGPVRAKLKIKADEELYVSLHFKTQLRPSLDLPFNPTIFYVLKDQSGRRRTRHHVHSFYPLLGSKKRHLHKYEEWTGLYKSWLTRSRYNAGDSVVMDIYVQPPTTARAVHSYDGVLNWTFDQCRRRKRAEEGCLLVGQQSPYFYTAPEGYRLGVTLYLTATEEENHRVGLFISFLAGEFDDQLSASFPHRTTVTVMNPLRPLGYVTKIVEENIPYNREYYLDVCSGDEMDRLMADGVLYCRVAVQSKPNFVSHVETLFVDFLCRFANAFIKYVFPLNSMRAQ